MTRGSFSIGELFGIPVRVHVALVVLVAVVVGLAGNIDEAGQRLALVSVVLSAVLVHELGHALVARRHGLRTLAITLTPVGGVASLEAGAQGGAVSARAALAIAAAGPLANLGCGVLVLPFALLLPVPATEDIVATNLILGAFNLVPAFPLDGGRILRTLLEPSLGPLKAARRVSVLGRVLAAAGLGVAVWRMDPLLAALSLFVFVAGVSEARRQLVMGVVGSQRVFDAMQPVCEPVTTFTPLPDALTLLTEQPDLPALPVLFGDRVVGVVHRQPVVMAALGEVAVTLGDLLDRNVVTQDGDGPLVALLLRMRASGSSAAVILRGEVVAGVLTLEQVAASVRAAIHGPPGSANSRVQG